MIYHDISVPISPEMHVYEGDPPVEIAPFSSIEKGELVNVTRLHISTHTGTHIDAPLHFIQGARPIEETPLDTLIGPAVVVEVLATREISRKALGKMDLPGSERVLFKTINSALWRKKGFQKDFAYISGPAAEYLVEIGVKLVGIDYLSVEKFGVVDPVAHLTLLKAGVIVLEGLNLLEVQAGRYDLICLPLRIRNGDGSPCRAVLVEK